MSVPDPERHTLIFLGGLHRSGTTFLARALAAHPAVSGLTGTGVPEDEGEHLQSVYPDSWEHGSVGRFGFAPAAHLTEASPLVTDENRRTLFDEWAPHWDLSRPYLLEKSPPNMLKLRFLEAMFPRSRAVVILRHPVAVAGAHLKWRTRFVREVEPHRLVRHWLHCHEILAADAPCVRHLLLLRYEDLVRDPHGEMARILAFLGLEESEAPVEVRDENSKYFEAWRAGNRARRAYIRAIEGRYEERLRRFGYSFASPEPIGDISLDGALAA
jgi:hypothetical protein